MMMSQWWVAGVLSQPNGAILLGSWVVWVIGSIVLHELGHGWAAMACGDETPRWTGHMTWNPVVHMGWGSLVVFALLGIAWGAMPVDPSRFRGRYDDALVAFAGPMVNVLLSAGSLLAYCVWTPLAGGYWLSAGAPHELYVAGQIFFFTGAMLNLALALFNMAPVPPLDGSRILASLFPPYQQLMQTEVGRVLTIVLIIATFSVGGSVIFPAARRATRNAADQVLGLIAPSVLSPPASLPPPPPPPRTIPGTP